MPSASAQRRPANKLCEFLWQNSDDSGMMSVQQIFEDRLGQGGKHSAVCNVKFVLGSIEALGNDVSWEN